MLDISILKKLSKINVLVVDSNKITIQKLKNALSLYCKNVYFAKDGIEGFELFQRNRPDVIISDINLPELNGLEMVHLIHEISPSIPVIIATANDSSKNILESIKQGVYTYLRKPIAIEELQIALLLAAKNIYNSKIYLDKGFIYDKESKLLFTADKNEVPLTKLEKELLHLLISNINKIVEYSTIENYVWQNRSMSIKALRMRIKEIRHKTYCNIIENISGCGYRINSYK
ncbi:response regulator transcription factor [Halarcobacter anaerophilus]|jgi:DNA-binding response OmpR family regulator|uniref:Two-component system response regulator n=1 Tax=Halarcobacter anaerophilus TaxID=877500 RepID=A0A4Q0Y2X7_9BACT|nr:response regulator [Halarcobacter anaerophilus]QDF28936.1 two-component system response regulator [Halarcobacter anaerophilus]RXJ63574.1 two-component system response regulator [Halarcobacter anaerophilus]